MTIVGLIIFISFLAIEDSWGGRDGGCGHMFVAIAILTACVITDFLMIVT